MQEQKDKARKARKVTNYMGADVTVYESIDPAVTTEFVGYEIYYNGTNLSEVDNIELKIGDKYENMCVRRIVARN